MTATKFVYTELHCDEIDAARRFYSALFGWEFKAMQGAPVPYAMIRSETETVGGATKTEDGSLWLSYVGVSDVAATTGTAESLGATVIVQPREVPGMGVLSVVADPTGARIALWQAAAPAVAQNEWSMVIDHSDILELRWLPSTASMTDGGFMASLCLFASEAEKRRPGALLIDATVFTHKFGPKVMEWRDATIIPRYGAAGTRRFAFVMPPGFPNAGREAHEGTAIFPTKWFLDKAAAMEWLRER
jgi:predicted enzyme related to lactoylglutathione lyase